jgi:hypothetical protein
MWGTDAQGSIDWWDRRVYARSGELLGVVVGVYDSELLGAPAWLAVGMGVYGLRMAVVPVPGSLLWGADVVIAHDRDTVLSAPPGDIYVTIASDDEARLLAHYTNPSRLVPPT